MKHKHKATGTVFECGELIEIGTNKTYDITVITYWPASGEQPTIIDYYFGEYDPETTDYYIDEWFTKRVRNNSWLDILVDIQDIVDAYRITNDGVLDAIMCEKVDRVLHTLKKTLNLEAYL